MWYRSRVPDKEGARFDDLLCKKAHRPRNAVFLRVYAGARPLWAAVVGGFGLPVFFFAPVRQPATCRPPRVESGRGLTTDKGCNHA